MFSDADFAARTHQAIPLVRLGADLPGKKNLHPPLQEIADCWIVRTKRLGSAPPAPPIESRGEYSSVVENEKIVGAKRLGKVPECRVRYLSSSPVES
jgi:hypothetical protein